MQHNRERALSRVLCTLLAVTVCGGTLFAADLPLAVSPGETSRLAVIEDSCPTFSWGGVDGAESYELVVYRLRGERETEEQVLRRIFDGSVQSWTPSMESCFERGSRYAWTVRSVSPEELSGWSVPSLFRVAKGPAREEFETALEVVRSYMARQKEVEVGRLETPAPEISRRAERSPARTLAAAPALASTALKVDLGVEAASFTGDGSALTAVDADLLDGSDSTDFASVSHAHIHDHDSIYAATSHNHDSTYAAISHTHSHTHSASDITSGTLSTSRYSAYSDLVDGGRLDNNSSSDLLTRGQLDTRYASISHTHASASGTESASRHEPGGEIGIAAGGGTRVYGCGTYVVADSCPGGDSEGPGCDEVPAGSYCEADDECDLDDALDNCGSYDWFFKTSE